MYVVFDDPHLGKLGPEYLAYYSRARSLKILFSFTNTLPFLWDYDRNDFVFSNRLNLTKQL